jgi:hypothetical protein
MSFEKHATVSAYLSAHKLGLTGFNCSELDMYKAMAKDLYNQLKAYEEKEALSKVNHYEFARMNILYKLNESAKNDDRDGVTIYSQALQRI